MNRQTRKAGSAKLKRNEPLGERKIIEIVQKHLDLMPNMVIPFGDDVSAYPIGKDTLGILKTDMLVGKTDVPPRMTLRQAARKAVVMNISDFAAKGVKPLVMLVSLGLPKDITQEDVEQIGLGLNAGAREYDAYVIGGDTGEASDLVISISLFGIAPRRSVMLRSGAKQGDLVAVTGGFGKTAAGLRILLHELKESPTICEPLVSSVLMPKARLKEGLALNRIDAVTASIDSSDGLAWSLHEIARASKVGFLIDSLPTAEEAKVFAIRRNLDPVELTLYGGEEYELVLTIKPEMWSKAEKAVEDVSGNLIRIGKVTTNKRLALKIGAERRLIEPRGYEHFKSGNV